MYKKVSIIGPLLHQAVAAKVQSWPTFDGATLDRTLFVSSSEVGKCARQIWFGKNVPAVEGNFKWGFAERGHGHEAWIVGKLRSIETEYTFSYLGDEQVSFYDGYQSGTPDGLFYKDGEYGVIDFKSVDPRTKRSNLPKDEHVKQVVQNLDIMEACLGIEISGALIVYSDASDFSMVDEYWIDSASPEVGELVVALEQRAETIMKAERAEDVPAEGLYNGGCKTCPFGSLCTATVMATKMEKNRYDKLAKIGNAVFG